MLWQLAHCNLSANTCRLLTKQQWNCETRNICNHCENHTFWNAVVSAARHSLYINFSHFWFALLFFFNFTGAHWLVSQHFYLPWKPQETAAIQWQQATSHNYSPTIQVHKSPYRCPGSETVCLKWMDNLSFVIYCQDFQLLDTANLIAKLEIIKEIIFLFGHKCSPGSSGWTWCILTLTKSIISWQVEYH